MENQFKELFFLHLDGEKEKYKKGSITKSQLKSTIHAHRLWFIKEYYEHVMSINSESKEFMETFLSIFPEEVKLKS